MREVEFRAWDIIHKKMIELDAMWFDNYGNVNAVNDIIAGLTLEKEDFILIQYTGLRDKNGKKIYEGDIVENSCGDIVEIEFFNDLNFDDGGGKHSGFYFKSGLEYYDGGPKTWKIIGNIHENPELSEKEK